MSFMKPGKLKPAPKAKKNSKARVWDDFGDSEVKKTRNKQTYSVDHDKATPVKKAPRGPGKGGLSFSEDDNLPPTSVRDDYEHVEKIFDYSFNDKERLERALTHRSAFKGKPNHDYERLEFLGDAVLGLTIADLLSSHYPDASEGNLSKMRAALVNTTALAEIAKENELGDFIKLGRGEASSGGSERPSILADVMEAIFGAMYRDSDFETVFSKIKNLYGQRIKVVNPSDPKTELQELLHIEGSEAPNYQVELVEGPVHAPIFIVIALVDGEVAGRGKGPTKKAAQQSAAADVLSSITPAYNTPKLSEEQNFFIKEMFLTKENFHLPS